MFTPRGYEQFYTALLEEINRHKWIMSEKSQLDVGYETAFKDWLENFGKVWFEAQLGKPDKPSKPRVEEGSKANSKSKPVKKARKKDD